MSSGWGAWLQESAEQARSAADSAYAAAASAAAAAAAEAAPALGALQAEAQHAADAVLDKAQRLVADAVAELGPTAEGRAHFAEGGSLLASGAAEVASAAATLASTVANAARSRLVGLLVPAGEAELGSDWAGVSPALVALLEATTPEQLLAAARDAAPVQPLSPWQAEHCAAALEVVPALEALRTRLVPSALTSAAFWAASFHHTAQLNQQQHKEVLTRAPQPHPAPAAGGAAPAPATAPAPALPSPSPSPAPSSAVGSHVEQALSAVTPGDNNGSKEGDADGDLEAYMARVLLADGGDDDSDEDGGSAPAAAPPAGAAADRHKSTSSASLDSASEGLTG